MMSGCASHSQKNLVDDIQAIKGKSVNKIPVSSRAEALKYFHNQRNYLVLLFEQSRDPYYGTPKWTDECIKSNVLGRVTETSNMISMISNLYLDKDGNPGLCPESKLAIKSHFILIFCEGSSEVLNLKFPTAPEINLEKYQFCP
jgi:hypothetical protein